MLNEFVYCPRLFFLMWVQSEWADNYFTEHGKEEHRRVDAQPGRVPVAAEAAAGPLQVRSLELSSQRLGLIARLDVVILAEGGKAAEPIDYKRGSPPAVPERAWLPERVQLCAQGLLLREHGYHCERGWVYYTESKERVEVPFDDELIALTREAIAAAYETARQSLPPPPLIDSPKCAGCSLQGICLPDEVNELRHATALRPGDGLRRLHPASDDALPLYVTEQGARVGLAQHVLQVRDREGTVIAESRLPATSQVCVFGQVQVTTAAVRALCSRGIPLCYFSTGGWYYGRTEAIGHKNIDLRIAQYRAAADPGRRLELARRFVSAKVANCRTLLRRNASTKVEAVLRELRRLARRAGRALDLEALLGIEGVAARCYFGHFGAMLKPPGERASAESGDCVGTPDPLASARSRCTGPVRLALRLDGRNRRPPLDPVNALLSFTYALLVKDWTVTLAAVGLDPYLGFFHTVRYGRPALALDLMEEFRPLVADSVVLWVINNGMVRASDFIWHRHGVAMTPHARKEVLRAYEQRLSQEVTHPVFGYRISYRRVLEVQARLLGRYLLGEIPEYPSFRTR
ncbi:MAG: CRISPR-associated exonuclease Cas4/endonuclease Cas1 fusion [Planctomycetota bacterium]|nr:MAG: CRISPR-associated exonuclease Cas4/endonuclease Cas1 fusion [Planctomycetota bacterium]